MPAEKGDIESLSSSSRTSTDLVVYPPPVLRDDVAETSALLSNHDSSDSRPKTTESNSERENLENEDLEAGSERREERDRRLWRRVSKRASRLYNNNVGLLLITTAQAFFAFMNLFVKMLTASDVHVPALEVYNF
jgi:hypothetical protein